MKTETRVMDVTSTLEGEKITMGIDQNALAHIMSVLTDLYSDPVMAVIREYSTNAFDAHIQAGVTRPIEVTTPTALFPYFKVQDFGVGLTGDDIRDIYSQYGASTKRDSNDVVGMLGLGCKSALTYTDQFTLTSVKDGVCTQVSISRTEDGGGSMTIVAQYETDEEPGTMVIVPVKSGHDFEFKSKQFFRFWDEGTVLVNGKAPTRIDGIWFNDKIVMSSDLQESVIVMGNVAYPYDDGLYGYSAGYRTATFVNIGDVNFTPSREALQMTPKTKTAVQLVKDTVKAEKQAAYKRQIDAATTPVEAIKAYYEVTAIGYEEKKPEWNGMEIPVHFESSDPNAHYNFLAVHGRGGYGRAKGQRETRLYTRSVVQDNYKWFEGWTNAEFSPYKRRKLEKWCADNGVGIPNMWIMTDVLPADVKTWIKAENIYNWADVEAIKLPATGGSRRDGRPTGSYDTVQGEVTMDAKGVALSPKQFHSKYVRGVEADNLDTSKPMYWATKKEYVDAFLKLLNKSGQDGYTVVLLGDNRIAKFNRDFPKVERLRDAVKGIAEKWENSLTDEDKLYLAVQESDNLAMLKKLNGAQLDDPELVEAIRVASLTKNNLRTAYQEFGHYMKTNVLTGYVCPTKKYPLLDTINHYGYNGRKHQDHLALYVNAAYAAGQEN